MIERTIVFLMVVFLCVGGFVLSSSFVILLNFMLFCEVFYCVCAFKCQVLIYHSSYLFFLVSCESLEVVAQGVQMKMAFKLNLAHYTLAGQFVR